jgi:hypothetical protein
MGEFVIQTRKNIFLFVTFSRLNISVVLPSCIIEIEKAAEMIKELLLGYRQTVASDYNFLWDDKKMANSTEELLARRNRNRKTFVSKQMLVSDQTANRGLVEIEITRDNKSAHGMLMHKSGDLTSYFLPQGNGLEISTVMDLSANNSFGVRKYNTVRNRQENIRLVPLFWQIVEKIVGDDKVVAISESLPEELELGSIAANLYPVENEKDMIFRGRNPETWRREYKYGGGYFKGGKFTGYIRHHDSNGYEFHVITFVYPNGMRLLDLPILRQVAFS